MIFFGIGHGPVKVRNRAALFLTSFSILRTSNIFFCLFNYNLFIIFHGQPWTIIASDFCPWTFFPVNFSEMATPNHFWLWSKSWLLQWEHCASFLYWHIERQFLSTSTFNFLTFLRTYFTINYIFLR